MPSPKCRSNARCIVKNYVEVRETTWNHRHQVKASVVVVVVLPNPFRGMGARRPNSRATPQGLDHRSRIEREEPKIDLRTGSEAGQTRRRWLRSCRGCPQALQAESFFRLILWRYEDKRRWQFAYFENWLDQLAAKVLSRFHFITALSLLGAVCSFCKIVGMPVYPLFIQIEVRCARRETRQRTICWKTPKISSYA